jgi:hypothetical protein
MADSQPPESPDEKLPPLPGAEPLKEHIASLDKSVTEWCEEEELDRFVVQKLLSGRLQRVSVEIAFDIEAATNGVVDAKLWVPAEDIRDAQSQRRSATARRRARALHARKATGTEDGVR